MTEREYQKHVEAIRLKIFGDDSALPHSRTETLKLAKRFLKLKETRIKQRHRAGVGGAEICRMRSDVMDCLARQLWAESLAALPPDKRAKVNFSVVAHGGYGRRIMSPFSDVDLTFMLPGNGAQVPADTAKLIAAQLGLKPEQYTVCFQSRLGRDPWIQPYTPVILKERAAKGDKRLLVFSPAFVSDCLETTIEIGEEYFEEWHEMGGEHLQLVSSLNDKPAWMEAVANLVR